MLSFQAVIIIGLASTAVALPFVPTSPLLVRLAGETNVHDVNQHYIEVTLKNTGTNSLRLLTVPGTLTYSGGTPANIWRAVSLHDGRAALSAGADVDSWLADSGMPKEREKTRRISNRTSNFEHTRRTSQSDDDASEMKKVTESIKKLQKEWMRLGKLAKGLTDKPPKAHFRAGIDNADDSKKAPHETASAAKEFERNDRRNVGSALSVLPSGGYDRPSVNAIELQVNEEICWRHQVALDYPETGNGGYLLSISQGWVWVLDEHGRTHQMPIQLETEFLFQLNSSSLAFDPSAGSTFAMSTSRCMEPFSQNRPLSDIMRRAPLPTRFKLTSDIKINYIDEEEWTDLEKGILEEAVLHSRNNILKARVYMTDLILGKPGVSARRYIKWFGPLHSQVPNLRRRSDPYNGYEKVVHFFIQLDRDNPVQEGFVYSRECIDQDPDVAAYADDDAKPPEIHLCDIFFHHSRTVSQHSRTFIHEATHLRKISSPFPPTQDHSYDTEECQKLSPILALDNAQNFALFALDDTSEGENGPIEDEHRPDSDHDITAYTFHWRHEWKPDQKKIIMDTAAAGEHLVSEALEYFKAFPSNRDDYTEWFGTSASYEVDQVEDTFIDMRRENIFRKVKYDQSLCEDQEPGTDVYTRNSDVHYTLDSEDEDNDLPTFEICPPFFRLSASKRAAVLVGEATRIDDIGGTTDDYRSAADCRHLADTRPRKARKNASNYYYFVQALQD